MDFAGQTNEVEIGDDELLVRASAVLAKEPGARKLVPWETRQTRSISLRGQTLPMGAWATLSAKAAIILAAVNSRWPSARKPFLSCQWWSISRYVVHLVTYRIHHPK